MHCGRVTNLLSPYLDRELTGAEMLQVREHLGRCSACRQEYDDLADVKSMLGRAPVVEPRCDYVAATVLRLMVAQGAAPAERRRPKWLSWWWEMPGQRLRIAGLAAGLALALVATGVALRQPKDADSVVARLARMDTEEWSVRPWEMDRAGVSALPALWVDGASGARRAALSWPQGADGDVDSSDSAPLLVKQIVALQASSLMGR